MFFASWTRLVRSLFASPVKTVRKNSRRLQVEQLEERSTPATFTWTGGVAATNPGWSQPKNWGLSSLPADFATGNHDLVFPNSATLRNTRNDLLNATFNSLTFGGSNYQILAGSVAFTLGTGAAGGSINLQPGVTNITINPQITLGANTGSQFVLKTDPGSNITFASTASLRSTNVVTLAKKGDGIAILNGDNTNFLGAIGIEQGILRIQNPNALGNTLQGTTVLVGAQLQINNVTGAIGENLTINGPGRNNDGALLNFGGNNTWSGNITLDVNNDPGRTAFIGVASGTTLTINGSIGDTGNTNLTKEGAGELILAAANTYRGNTTVEDGTLTLQHSQALGTTDGGTLVRDTVTKTGMLKLDGSGGNLTIAENVVLNSAGLPSAVPTNGSLWNFLGDNIWNGTVTLGSGAAPNGQDVWIGVATGTTLTINGRIDDNTTHNLTKLLPGTLILTNANTYRGLTTIAAGAINIRDSKALGTSNGAADGTVVNNGAALELEVDNIVDSVTGNVAGLSVAEVLTLTGRGLANGPGSPATNTGALRSKRGINHYTGNITMTNGTGGSIGVDPDPTQSSDDRYLTDDESLTIDGDIAGQGSPSSNSPWSKLGTGHLIIPRSISTQSTITIEAGWITARHTGALGQRNPLRGDSSQPQTIVMNNAALHILPLNVGDDFGTGAGSGNPFIENLNLSGLGITHANPRLNQKGALLNLGGDNLFTGDIRLNGQVGIGVDFFSIPSGSPNYNDSRITFTGAMTELNPAMTGFVANSAFTKLGPGQLIIQGDGSFTGNNVIQEGAVLIQNDTALGLGGNSSTTVMSGAGLEIRKSVINFNGGISAGLQIWDERLILNGTGYSLDNSANGGYAVNIGALEITEGDNLWHGPVTLNNSSTISVAANSRLNINGKIDDPTLDDPINNPTATQSNLTKTGAGKLILSAANTYAGLTTVQAGVLNIQHSQALGHTIQGTVVADGATLELQGSITVAGESLTIQGDGVNSVVNTQPRWFEIGPAPIANGETQALPTRSTLGGRITGVVVDPNDPMMIYAATAGGGVWRTKDGGKTWVPLFDANVFAADGTTLIAPPIFVGAIAMHPTDNRILYIGTGEGNNGGDNFAGSGIFRSTDSGKTWRRLENSSGTANPLAGTSVTKILVDINSIVYVSTGNTGTAVPAGTQAGVWRFTPAPTTASFTGTWFNLTNTQHTSRNVSPNGFNLGIGPIDDGRISWRTNNVVWSDIALNGTTLYAALGTPGGTFTTDVFTPGTPPPFNIRDVNGVYRLPNADITTNPDWRVGSGGALGSNGGANPFPTGQNNGVQQGNIKIAIGRQDPFTPINTVWALVANANGSFRALLKTTDGGVNWNAAVATPPAANIFNGNTGNFNASIIARTSNNDEIIVAGFGEVYRSTDGTNFALLSNSGETPHTEYHALAFTNSNSTGAVGVPFIAGTDGGAWRYTITGNTWESLNKQYGGFQVAQLFSAVLNPFDPNQAFAGSKDNGTLQFSNAQQWSNVDDGNGGRVRYNPLDSNYIYHLQLSDGVSSSSANLYTGTGTLRRSTTGGAFGSWSNSRNNVRSFAVDVRDSSRVLITDPVTPGQTGVWQSLDNGATFIYLNGGGTNLVAPALLQGTYVYDGTNWPIDDDRGENGYDPETIWSTTGGSVFLTRDKGTNWRTRNGTGANILPGSNILDLIVDPRSRDTAFVVVDNAGIDKIYMTSDAGLNWAPITGTGFPGGVRFWKVEIDPRNGNIYAGSDIGVYRGVFDTGSSTWNWARFGDGMPNVQVRDLVLDVSSNTLVAATYGRGAFVLSLDDSPADPGALHAVSGAARWAGDVFLKGATTITANAPVVGQTPTSLDIQGKIQDDPAVATPANSTLTKKGLGTVTFSGDNTYLGKTVVDEGALRTNHDNALGATSAETEVMDGATLELQSNLAGERVVLNGNGPSFQGVNQGALRGITGTVTFSGELRLNTFQVTIGVESSATLVIAGQIHENVAANLIKALTGTLRLTNQNDYTGTTFVTAGVLTVAHSNALGTTAGGTQVYQGAELSLMNNITVVGELLELSGSGINEKGALRNLADANTWQGTVRFDKLPGTATTTTVYIGADGSPTTSILTIDGQVTQNSANGNFGLTKVGTGKVVLTAATTHAANDYAGLTDIKEGVLNIRDAQALGVGGTGAGLPASLIHDYQLNGNLNDVLGGPALVSNGGTVNFNNYSFGANQGLTLSNGLGGVPDTYSIEMVFRLADPTGYRALIGFKNQTQNEGLYSNDSALDFFDIVPGPTAAGPSGAFTANQDVHLVITRDGATDKFSAYINGVLQFSFTDSSDLASFTGPNNIIHFFMDDTVVTGQAGAGVVDFIRIYNAELTAAQVQSLYQDSPQTGTVVRAGAALEMQGGITVNNEELRLNSTGVSNTGALLNVSGNNTYGGPIVLQTNSSVGSTAGILKITSAIKDSGPAQARQLTKVGAATVNLTATNTYTGGTIVSAGNLQVDGSIFNVDVNQGGTLSGSGTVGNVTVQGATNPAFGGTISPGDNVGGGGDIIADLSTQNVTFNPRSIYFANVRHTDEEDELKVTGTVNLNNAILQGAAGSGIADGETFVIITATGGVTNRFANAPNNGDSVFLSGRKFTVTYNANNVVLNAAATNVDITNVTMNPTSPVQYGTNIAFDATFQSENGSLTITPAISPPSTPAGPAIFKLTRLSDNFVYPLVYKAINSNVATASLSDFGAVGSFNPDNYKLEVDFNATGFQKVNTIFPADGIASFTIAPASTTTVVNTPSATTSQYGNSITFTATVSPTTIPPTGTVNFYIANTGTGVGTGILLGSHTLVSGDNGVASITLTSETDLNKFATIGTAYNIVADFISDNGNVGNSNSRATARTHTVTARTTQATIVDADTVTPNTSPYGTSVTFNITVTGNVFGQLDNQTVTIKDGATTLGTAILTTDGGDPTKAIASFTTLRPTQLQAQNGTPHSITVDYTPNGANASHFLGDTSNEAPLAYTVTKINPTTFTVVSGGPGGPATAAGQNETVTITATINDAFGSTPSPDPAPTGTVTFYLGTVGGTVLDTETTPNASQEWIGTSTTIPQGATNTIIAVYSGDSNFNGGNVQTNQVIKSTSVVHITGVNATYTYGDPVTVSAYVTDASNNALTGTSSQLKFDLESDNTIEQTDTYATGTPIPTKTYTPPLSSLGAGSHSVKVTYVENDLFATSVQTVNFSVSQKGTTVALDAITGGPFQLGSDFTLKATVTASGFNADDLKTTTSGLTVTFYEVGNPTPLGSANIVNNGGNAEATWNITNPTVGSHTYRAVFNLADGGNFDTSTTAPTIGSNTDQTVVITQAGTTTTLANVSGTFSYPTDIVLTATITTSGPGLGTAEIVAANKTVSFYEVGNPTPLATIAVTNNGGNAQASYTVVAPNVGNHTYRAVFNVAGAGDFASSTTAPSGSNTDQAVTITQATTNVTSLTINSGNPSALEQSVPIVATVNVPVAALTSLTTAQKTVTFFDLSSATPTTPIGSAQLQNVSGTATASINFAFTFAGTHNIKAVFNDPNTGNYGRSEATQSHTVTKANPTVTLNPVAGGTAPSNQNLMLTGTVTGRATLNGTGNTVQLYHTSITGGNEVGSPVTPAANGTFSITVTAPITPGNYTYLVRYTGDNNNNNDDSDPITVTIKDPTSTNLQTSGSPSIVGGNSLTFTATVTNSRTSGSVGTGSVSFYVNGSGTPTYTDTDGTNGWTWGPSDTTSTNTLGAGTYSITAKYNGDAVNFLSASPMSNTVQQIVQKATSTITMVSTTPSGQSQAGQSVQLVAQVVGSGSFTPAGTVTFRKGVGGPIIGTQAFNGGSGNTRTATLNVTFTVAESFNIVAEWNGDSNYSGDVSDNSIAHTVVPGPVMSMVAVLNPVKPVINKPFTMTIYAYDAYGNLATNHTGTVSLLLLSGPGTFSGNGATATFSNGVATFTGLTVNKNTTPTNPYRIRARTTNSASQTVDLIVTFQTFSLWN